MRSRLSILSVLFFLSVSVFSVSAFAWEKGNLKINPGVSSESQWDSNIFYDSSNEKDDFITVITPSIKSELGFGVEGKHKARVNYEVALGIFSKYDEQNYGNHDLFGEIDLDFNDYFLKVNDRFLFTSSRAGTEFENRNLRKDNTLNAIVGADFNKLSFDVGYSYFLRDYHSSLLNQFDMYENSVWTTGYIKIMPKTKGLLEYKYTNIKYDDATGRDGNAHAVMAGVQGEITSKITGIIKAGYKSKIYKNSARDDFSSAVVHTSLAYDPTDRLNINLAYEREGFESTYSNNNYYTGDHVLTDLNYKFGPDNNFVAKANGQYFFNDYPETGTTASVKRQDHLWSIGTGLDYHWKDWIVCGIGYAFTQRESNIGSRDYDQHVISTDMRLVF